MADLPQLYRPLRPAVRHDGQALASIRCPLCRHPVVLSQRPDARCPACHSPLALLPEADAIGQPGHPGPMSQMGQMGQIGQMGSRRAAVRRDQSHVALMHLGWPSTPMPVRWRDLSLTGLSLYAPQALEAGQRLRLSDSALEVVAEVVGCRPQGRLFVVHARLLTALLLQATGVFVSAQA